MVERRGQCRGDLAWPMTAGYVVPTAVDNVGLPLTGLCQPYA